MGLLTGPGASELMLRLGAIGVTLVGWGFYRASSPAVVEETQVGGDRPQPTSRAAASGGPWAPGVIPWLLAGYAGGQILWLLLVWANHLHFPLNLEAMELVRLEHVQRLLQGLPLYPEPSREFIALAYNPLSYLVTLPFAWLFGPSLATMRLVAILAAIAAGAVLFSAIKQETDSNWWSLIGLGLFAAAYRVMDTYLDNAHADSLLLLCILLGSYWLNQSVRHAPRSHSGISSGASSLSQVQAWAGVAMLVAGFWMKQQGGIFLLGGLVFLWVRQGWRRSWGPTLLALGLGVGLYVLLPDHWLGPRFHYFTWQVPRQWVEFTPAGLVHFLKLLLGGYGILALVGVVVLWRLGRRGWASLSRRNSLRTPGALAAPVSLWSWMLPVAIASGVVAELTPGSNNNVFIPMGTWLILTGVLELHRWATGPKAEMQRRWGLPLLGVGLSFALLVYPPGSVWIPAHATQTYGAFLSYLRSLDAPIYAPWLGPLPPDPGYQLSSTLHWVPLEDIFRGPRSDATAHPPMEQLLPAVYNPPQGKAYLLHLSPLEEDFLLQDLWAHYSLEADLGDRFRDLATLPKRFPPRWPRYLYRYHP